MISYKEFLNFIINENPQTAKNFKYLDCGLKAVDIEKIYSSDKEKSVKFYKVLGGIICDKPCVMLKIEGLSDLNSFITPMLNRPDNVVVVVCSEDERVKDYYKVWYIE